MKLLPSDLISKKNTILTIRNKNDELQSVEAFWDKNWQNSFSVNIFWPIYLNISQIHQKLDKMKTLNKNDINYKKQQIINIRGKEEMLREIQNFAIDDNVLQTNTVFLLEFLLFQFKLASNQLVEFNII